MEVSRLDYFAANAPEVPNWYKSKIEFEDPFDHQKYLNSLLPPIGVKVPDSALEDASKKTTAAHIAHNRHVEIKIYFGWRKYYAEQMVKMLPIAGSGDEVTGD